jgi:hypothetical protein
MKYVIQNDTGAGWETTPGRYPTQNAAEDSIRDRMKRDPGVKLRAVPETDATRPVAARPPAVRA